MKLGELAFACFVFKHFDNGAYGELLRTTGKFPDLANELHRRALLKWLNEWGCRHIAKDYHNHAAQQMEEWYHEFSGRLFGTEHRLQQLNDQDFIVVEDAYRNLCARIAAYRFSGNGRSEKPVRFGATATAKLLFAIRPEGLIAWDGPIAKAYDCDTTAESYVRFLRRIQAIILELEAACNMHGLCLRTLPDRIGRSNSTVPKLIDEYHWVTITNKCRPRESDFESWYRWINRNT
jgi:hypothetical protein